MSLLDDYVNATNTNGAAEQNTNGLSSSGLAQFKVEQVSLPGSLDIADAVVKNNILVIAVANNKLLRIDLSNPAEIQDLEVPRSKNTDPGTIRKIFLDDTGHHLFVSMSTSENWYLHSKLSKPAKLRVRGVVECIAWNASGTQFATKEILLGMAGGSIFETWLEPIEGFNKTVERYSKQVHSAVSGESIIGLHMYTGSNKKERHLLLATNTKIEHYRGILSSSNGDAATTPAIFQSAPGVQEFQNFESKSQLSICQDEAAASGLYFAWYNSSGILHGPAPFEGPGDASFEDSRLIGVDKVTPNDRAEPTSYMELSKYHILMLRGSALHAFNRFDEHQAHQEDLVTLDKVQGMMCDPIQQTYWLFTRTELFEIVITDEAQEMWQIYLKKKDYGAALRFASTPAQTNSIYAAQAAHNMDKGEYQTAADLFARSDVPIEQVSIKFLELDNREALLIYLQRKLDTTKKTAEMQRIMLATWILELFLSRISANDDLRNNMGTTSDANTFEELATQYAAFIAKHKLDLDRTTTYALINSHGRQEELMVYANVIDDYEYIVNHLITQDKFAEALALLSKHPNIELTYTTSTILLPAIPRETVEMWMRMSALDPARLLPAILAYNSQRTIPITDNQAVRYLKFAIKHQGNTDAVIHNYLIGILARDCAGDESSLLSFLESQESHPYYDSDFVLRQCKQHDRLLSCVHIYSQMGFYDQAVQWALQHDNVQLASVVADRVEDNPSLRKKLWLMIAKKTISQEGGVKSAIEMSKKSDVIRIEDLVPHFDDFTVIDDFKDEICAALESYSTSIETLRNDMDESSRTAEAIVQNIKELKKRFAVVHVGEECFSCHRPLMEKQFYVFPCQHTFHSECLVSSVLRDAAPSQRRRIAQLQSQIAKVKDAQSQKEQKNAKEPKLELSNGSTTSTSLETQSQKLSDELDDLVAAECLLCGSLMIRSIDEGFKLKDEKADSVEAASWQV